MRTGTNPAKAGVPAYRAKPLGVALITYIPFTEGYFENSLQILKFQIESLRASTAQPFDLLIFDNGSCPEIVDELQTLYSQKIVDWLVLSQHNLGKAGAWNWIFACMPNELICYADSDVLFRSGWLEASQAVLQAFPTAGMIGAQPNFFDVMEGEGKAQLALQDDPRYHIQEYQPSQEIIDEYCLGIGASKTLAAQFQNVRLPAVLDQSSGVQAVLGASHMQFIIPQKVARQVVPLPATKALLRRETMSLDHKIDSLGYLHLSVLQPYVFHMGNTINAHLLQEVRAATGVKVTLQDEEVKRTASNGQLKRWLAKLARQPRLKPHFIKAYRLLFQVLNAED